MPSAGPARLQPQDLCQKPCINQHRKIDVLVEKKINQLILEQMHLGNGLGA